MAAPLHDEWFGAALLRRSSSLAEAHDDRSQCTRHNEAAEISRSAIDDI